MILKVFDCISLFRPWFAENSHIGQDFLSHEILDGGLVSNNVKIGIFQERFFAIENSLTNVGLHLGVAEFALPSGFFFGEFDEMVTKFGGYRTLERLPYFQALDRLTKFGINRFLLLSAQEPEISSGLG